MSSRRGWKSRTSRALRANSGGARKRPGRLRHMPSTYVGKSSRNGRLSVDATMAKRTPPPPSPTSISAALFVFIAADDDRKASPDFLFVLAFYGFCFTRWPVFDAHWTDGLKRRRLTGVLFYKETGDPSHQWGPPPSSSSSSFFFVSFFLLLSFHFFSFLFCFLATEKTSGLGRNQKDEVNK